MKKYSGTHRDTLNKELRVWQAELTRIQQALPLEMNCAKLKDVELPSLLQEQNKLEVSFKKASLEAAAFSERLEGAKASLRSLQSLKQQASLIASAVQRRNTTLQHVNNLESMLLQSSSIKSLDEIQTELAEIQSKQLVCFFTEVSRLTFTDT